MRRSKKALFFLVSLMLTFGTALVGCTGTKETKGSQSQSASGNNSSADAAKEIKIGAIYPLTGNLASVGVQSKHALELAADIINNKYNLELPFAKTEGIPSLGGAKIKLIFADSAGKAEQAASEAERLISSEKVSALIGSYASSNTATVAQLAERNGIPYLTPESSSPSLTKKGFKWFFRTTPHDEFFVNSFFDFLDGMKQKGKEIKTVAILNENSLWGTDTSKLELNEAQKRGYQVVEHVAYPANTTDMSSVVQKLKAANPDVLLATSYTSDAILFMKTANDLKFAPKAFVTSGVGYVDAPFREALGSQANNIISREVWNLDLVKHKPIIGEINKLYKEKYGKDLQGDPARGLQGLLVMADALQRAASTEPGALQKALLETDIPAKDLVMPWEGVKFDPQTHQNVKAQSILVQMEKGVNSTVWPFDYATKEVVWPFSQSK